MARPYTHKLLDTTACQRLKVMVRVVCRDPDTGQEVSVRVRTPGNPESAVAQIHIHVFWRMTVSVGPAVDDRRSVVFNAIRPNGSRRKNVKVL